MVSLWIICCAQSYLTLCDPVDCSRSGSSAHGIIPARILAWVAISFSTGSSWPRNWTHVSCVSCIIGRRVLYHQCHLGIPWMVILPNYILHKVLSPLAGNSPGDENVTAGRAYTHSNVVLKCTGWFLPTLFWKSFLFIRKESSSSGLHFMFVYKWLAWHWEIVKRNCHSLLARNLTQEVGLQSQRANTCSNV